MSPRYKNRKKRIVDHGLKDVALRELGVELDKDHQKADWGGELTSEMLEYAAKDSQVLPPLVEAFDVKAQNDELEKVLRLERRATLAMVWKAAAGVPIDEEGWKEYQEKMKAEVAKAIEKIDSLAPRHPEGKAWNWNSPSRY